MARHRPYDIAHVCSVGAEQIMGTALSVYSGWSAQ
jgi:hypothetical protein